MGDIRVEVALDSALSSAAEVTGLDVAFEAERALRPSLEHGAARTKDERDEVNRQLARYDAYVGQNGSFSDEWRTF